MPPLDHLPTHPIPDSARAAAGNATLLIQGLVERPLALRAADLADLPRATLSDDFVCAEGWSVADLRWEGVRLSQVLALAGPLPEAGYIRVYAEEYAVPLPLEQASQALLFDRLDGQPLPLAHGAPWRLLLPGGACYTSVKWVSRLELCAEPGEQTGQQIAHARLAQARAEPQ
jgi:DMSO/TMAO reductase YedYZ molybdopterin-dependent catalytic subunit